MKCAYYQKKKQDRMTSEDKRHLNEFVDDFMQKLITAGVDKTLGMTQKENEKKEEEN